MPRERPSEIAGRSTWRWRDLPEAWLRLALVELMLARRPVDSIDRWIERRTRTGLRPSARRIEQLGLASRAVAARRPGGRCLARSLALKWALARRGLVGVLRFGVAQPPPAGPDRLRAHAWLELDGRPVAERPDLRTRFRPLEPHSS